MAIVPFRYLRLVMFVAYVLGVMVACRSPKPGGVGSNPTGRAQEVYGDYQNLEPFIARWCKGNMQVS